MSVGILSLQGAASPHAAMLSRLGVETTAVRSRSQLESVDGLVMPGGESTTMSMLMARAGLADLLAERLAAGMPTFGTCAGMILLAREVLDGRVDQRAYGAIDIAVRRNGYGRQVDSFEADLDLSSPSGPVIPAGLSGLPFHAVFIRAPLVEQVGPDVSVLARAGEHAVLCRQGHALVASFHPELGDDPRIHQYFVEQVMGAATRLTLQSPWR